MQTVSWPESPQLFVVPVERVSETEKSPLIQLPLSTLKEALISRDVLSSRVISQSPFLHIWLPYLL